MKLIPLGGRGNEYLKLPEGSNIIWLDRFKTGYGRRQESLRTTEPIVARKKRDEIFAEWFGEKAVLSSKVRLPNRDRWPDWEKTKARKSQATRDSIMYSGKHLLPFIGDLFPDQITEAWWENVYIPKKREESPNRKFFNEWKWLTTYLAALHRAGIITLLPRLNNPDPPTEEGLFLHDSEIAGLYANGNEDLQLQIDLGFEHFMRRSEVLLLPFSEINFNLGHIDLPAERTKIRKARTIPINDKTMAKLESRRSKSKAKYVFPSPIDPTRSVSRTGNRTAWNAAIERANERSQVVNPAATFHDLRHSGLTRAVAATNRYLEICVVAGLSLEQLQETYLHLKPEHTKFVSDLVKFKVENDRQ
jgi:integrase